MVAPVLVELRRYGILWVLLWVWVWVGLWVQDACAILYHEWILLGTHIAVRKAHTHAHTIQELKKEPPFQSSREASSVRCPGSPALRLEAHSSFSVLIRP
jgi:hypothetical protein